MSEHKHLQGPVRCVEISPEVCLRPTSHGGAEHIRNADGTIAGGSTAHLAGFLLAHEGGHLGDGYRCEGVVNVDPHLAPKPLWEMTGSLEGGDLTLSPSVLCSDGFHGFVRNGKWVPA
ncbi:MAG: hypothetical protein HY873_13160 [Chloroflexi bacterium]|nr:hypothetical protein [Chloroflexota bacterium]